jgi:hypothetical protein
MSDTTISPLMGMPVPNVGVDPSPDWATNIVASLSIIDGHTHSSGSGNLVTPTGLNINVDLPMGGNNLISIRSCRYQSQSAALSATTDLNCTYVSGVDLYYNDGNGNQIRLTSGGSIVGSAGSISGLPSGTASASYSAGTFTWQSATNTPANMAVGPLIIGRNAAASKTVTLQPDAAQAANYNMTFPAALPGAGSNYMTLSSAGAIAFNSAGSTGTGAVVLATAPTMTLSNATGLPVASVVCAVAGSNPAAGILGQKLTNNPGTTAFGSTGVNKTYNTLTLTAGVWLIMANCVFTSATAAITEMAYGISTTTNSFDDVTLGNYATFYGSTSSLFPPSDTIYLPPVMRFLSTTGQNVYAVGQVLYSGAASNFVADSYLIAIRIG